MSAVQALKSDLHTFVLPIRPVKPREVGIMVEIEHVIGGLS